MLGKRGRATRLTYRHRRRYRGQVLLAWVVVIDRRHRRTASAAMSAILASRCLRPRTGKWPTQTDPVVGVGAWSASDRARFRSPLAARSRQLMIAKRATPSYRGKRRGSTTWRRSRIGDGV